MSEWVPLKDIFRAPEPGEEDEGGMKTDRAIGLDTSDDTDTEAEANADE